MIIQYLHNQQKKMIEKKWLDELEVMKLMPVSDNTLDVWRRFNVIDFCNIGNTTYYAAADIEWLEELKIPVRN